MISKASVQPPRGVRILVLSRSQVTASSLSLSLCFFLYSSISCNFRRAVFTFSSDSHYHVISAAIPASVAYQVEVSKENQSKVYWFRAHFGFGGVCL